MFCVNCGKEIKENWKFCLNCGFNLSGITDKKDSEEQPKIDYSGWNFDDDFEEVSETASQPESAGITRVIPTISNFEQMFNAEYEKKSKVGYEDKMDICVRWEDQEEPVPDDVTECVFNSINITKKKNVTEDTWDIYGIKAYALGSKGIYFVMGDDRIVYMNETGNIKTLASQPNIMSMEWEEVDRTLKIKVYKSMTKIASREHRDECGYMYEAWYDVYQIYTETKTLTVNYSIL